MKNKGFTLLELLVVIGIISILMALGAISYNLAQAKGRDSRRVSDMKAAQNALEQYYANTGFKYPTNCTDATAYMKGNWPVDPYNGVISSKNYSYNFSCDANNYCLCARLEKNGGNYGDPDSDPNPPLDCSVSHWSSAGGEYYCVANLQ